MTAEKTARPFGASSFEPRVLSLYLLAIRSESQISWSQFPLALKRAMICLLNNILPRNTEKWRPEEVPAADCEQTTLADSALERLVKTLTEQPELLHQNPCLKQLSGEYSYIELITRLLESCGDDEEKMNAVIDAALQCGPQVSILFITAPGFFNEAISNEQRREIIRSLPVMTSQEGMQEDGANQAKKVLEQGYLSLMFLRRANQLEAVEKSGYWSKLIFEKYHEKDLTDEEKIQLIAECPERLFMAMLFYSKNMLDASQFNQLERDIQESLFHASPLAYFFKRCLGERPLTAEQPAVTFLSRLIKKLGVLSIAFLTQLQLSDDAPDDDKLLWVMAGMANYLGRYFQHIATRANRPLSPRNYMALVITLLFNTQDEHEQKELIQALNQWMVSIEIDDKQLIKAFYNAVTSHLVNGVSHTEYFSRHFRKKQKKIAWAHPTELPRLWAAARANSGECHSHYLLCFSLEVLFSQAEDDSVVQLMATHPEDYLKTISEWLGEQRRLARDESEKKVLAEQVMRFYDSLCQAIVLKTEHLANIASIIKAFVPHAQQYHLALTPAMQAMCQWYLSQNNHYEFVWILNQLSKEAVLAVLKQLCREEASRATVLHYLDKLKQPFLLNQDHLADFVSDQNLMACLRLDFFIYHFDSVHAEDTDPELYRNFFNAWNVCYDKGWIQASEVNADDDDPIKHAFLAWIRHHNQFPQGENAPVYNTSKKFADTLLNIQRGSNAAGGDESSQKVKDFNPFSSLYKKIFDQAPSWCWRAKGDRYLVALADLVARLYNSYHLNNEYYCVHAFYQLAQFSFERFDSLESISEELRLLNEVVSKNLGIFVTLWADFGDPVIVALYSTPENALSPTEAAFKALLDTRLTDPPQQATSTAMNADALKCEQ